MQSPYKMNHDLAGGENRTFSFKTDTVGGFTYYCIYDLPSMTGHLEVLPWYMESKVIIWWTNLTEFHTLLSVWNQRRIGEGLAKRDFYNPYGGLKQFHLFFFVRSFLKNLSAISYLNECGKAKRKITCLLWWWHIRTNEMLLQDWTLWRAATIHKDSRTTEWRWSIDIHYCYTASTCNWLKGILKAISGSRYICDLSARCSSQMICQSNYLPKIAVNFHVV